MKICMVTTSEVIHDTRILSEAETLSKNHQVLILAKKYPNQNLPKKVTFKIKLIDYKRFKNFRYNIYSSFIALIKAVGKENPDVFHAHDLDGLLCSFLAAIKKRKTLIYDSHELWSDTFPFENLKGIQRFLGPLEKFLMLKVNSGITVNGSISKYLEDRYKKEFLPLYNLPEEKLSKESFNLKKLFPNKKIILHLGSADEGRGMEQMIDAVKYLPNNYLLVFIGGGKTENIIVDRVKKMKLSHKVKFIPAVLPEEIIKTIKTADLGLALTQNVSKSYYLSLPNKIFQYISAGLPILSSNFPEFKKIVLKEKIGEVVNPANPKEIAKQIKKIINNQKKYRNNYKKIREKYTWKNEGNKLLRFYDNLEKNTTKISRRFKIDVIANTLSLAFLGIAGIFLNVIVSRVYGSSGLGIFNEVYAIYIIASQFAVGSIHLSVQKYLPSYENNNQERNRIISSGIVLTILFSLLISTVVFLSRNVWTLWFKDEQVAVGVSLVSFGLIGFSLNKTMLAVLNGFRLMRPYAFFSGLRYLFIVLSVIMLTLMKYPLKYLPVSFTIAESLLFILIFLYSLKYFIPTITKLGEWFKKHIIFAYKSLLGNVLLDINTRIDILVLGLFVSPKSIGIYSFAALLIEGISQIITAVLKANVNPILAKLATKEKINDLEKIVKRGIRLTYLYFFGIALASVLLYPILIKVFLGADFYPSILVFVILITGLTISSGYQPFQMLLAQAGYPALYSWLIVIVFIVNLVGNLVLVPFFGIYGSAIATGFSFVSLAIGVKVLTKKALKLKI